MNWNVKKMNRILITGGAGFIGSAVARHIINSSDDCICVVDKLTYAGNMENLEPVSTSPRFRFEKADICDKAAMDDIFSSLCVASSGRRPSPINSLNLVCILVSVQIKLGF